MLEEFEAELTSKRTVRGFDKHDIVQDELDNAFQMKRAVDYLRKSRQHLVYTGKLFTVKPDVFTKINLDPIPTLIDLNMEYYTAVFNMPLIKVQRDNPSADTVTSIAQELMELKTIMLEARASADKQRSDAGHLLTQEVRKVILEIEANSIRKLQEVFAEAASKQKILDDPTHVIPGFAQCGSMQKYIEKMLLEIVNVTNKTRKINLCPSLLIETKVFRNRPVIDLQRQFLLENSCHDIRRKQAACKSGMYIIQPPLLGNGQCRRIVCDMEFEGGGWTEFQTRGDYFPVEDFHRPWVDFKSGFGDFDREYWLGNELLWALTNSDKTTVYELYIEMEDWDGNKRFARYNSFRVGSEAEGFPLYFRGTSYKGNAGNSLAYHNASRFSSYDKDNDNYPPINCADRYKGGWWFKYCAIVNLNGVHLRGVHKADSGGIRKDWLGSNYSLKSSRMMFRPENFTDILNSSNATP